MIYQANELQAKLDCLIMLYQNEDGTIEWMGTELQWGASEKMAKRLLKEFNEPF